MRDRAEPSSSASSGPREDDTRRVSVSLLQLTFKGQLRCGIFSFSRELLVEQQNRTPFRARLFNRTRARVTRMYTHIHAEMRLRCNTNTHTQHTQNTYRGHLQEAEKTKRHTRLFVFIVNRGGAACTAKIRYHCNVYHNLFLEEFSLRLPFMQPKKSGFYFDPLPHRRCGANHVGVFRWES